jgi:phage shock protein A
MNLLTKIWYFIIGKTNDIVDNNLDAAVLARQAGREMDDDIAKFEKALTQLLTQKNLVEADCIKAEQRYAEWTDLTKMAVDKNDEEKANKAALKAVQYKAEADASREALKTISVSTDNLKAQLAELKRRRSNIEFEIKNLDARAKAAEATMAVQSVVNGTKESSTSELLELARRKTMEAEAKVSANKEVGTDSETSLKESIEGTTSTSNEALAKALIESFKK